MNKAILMGRLTRNPELSYTPNNVEICKFALAIDRRFSKNKEVDFINITAWQKTAEFCSKYFTKGQKISLIGRIQIDTWEDENGKKRYSTNVVAEEVYFVESKNSNATESNNDEKNTSVDDGSDDLPF